MNRRNANVRKFSFTSLRDAASVLLLTALLTGAAVANTVTDGSTPLALTPGAPAGSYPLSGLDNINLYNGNLNFRLPLLEIGGRGGARHSLGRVIEQHWRMDHQVLPGEVEIHTPLYNPWTPLDVGYSPGVLYGRQVNEGGCQQGLSAEGTLTRLTFVAADGTEFELRDKLTGGEVRTSVCPLGGGPFARGTVFVTADGASATFVSDTVIYDRVGGSPSSSIYPTGYLMLRDGTRYRIVNGRVSWLRDRNGNQMTFSYPNSGSMVATDPLGRQITVTANVSDAQPYGLCDHITFNGFGGAPRTIRVSKTNLGGALRAGYDLQTPAALFGYGSSSTPHNPQVTSAVWLPDGKSYQLRYNSYGELARVELPTGGAFEYDYGAGLTGGAAGGVFYTNIFVKPEIYRRVVEKRIYKEGGALEGRMTVSRTASQYTDDTSVTVDYLDPAGTLLSRSKHYFHGNPAKYMEVGPMEYQPWKHGREYQTESYDAAGTTALRRVEHTWQQPIAGSSWPLTQPETNNFAKTNNPQITETRTVLVDTNQVSKITFSYDQYSNRTDTWEYDFGAGAPPAFAARHSQTTFLTTNPVNGQDYASPNPSANSIHLRSLPQHGRVYSVNPSNGAQTQVAHTETVYDETALQPWYGAVTQWADPGGARGNPTKVRRWVDQPASYVETRAEYDQVGNVSKAVDALNRETLLQFSGAYAHALPTQFTSPVPDPSGTHGSNTALVTTRVYDTSTGLVTSSTDPNNKVTTLEYNDPLDRLTRVNRPDGGWTTYTYATNQHGDYVNAVTLLNASGAQLSQYHFFDGLGRPSRAFHHENHDPANPWLTSDTQYDAMGRVWRVSRTYRSAGSGSPVNPPGRWTETAYDSLGRVKTVTTRPDNAVVTTAYSGNQLTVTDQDNKSRRSVTDALGRLAQVVEDPGGLAYVTSYQYDALDNLRKVDQGGQFRFFRYDSLGRLLRVKHPEQAVNANLALGDPVTGNSQWSLAYAYDNAGNVTSRTDARGLTVTFGYDNLNRNTLVDYPDTTLHQDVRRHYDGATNGRGRFWCDFHYRDNWARAEHVAIDAYDAAGRPLNRRQHFYESASWQWGPAFNTQYAYDRAGNVTSMTYPSGRSVSYSYDAAGRLSAFTGNLGDSAWRNYATGIVYDEMGGPRQEQFGTDTPVYNKRFYNSRGQMSELRVSTYSINTQGQEGNWNRGALINRYSWQSWAGSGTDNNGNLRMQMIYIPNDDQISGYQMNALAYTYDPLNRLDKVEEFADGSAFRWRQDYDYDRWGNRTVNAANTTDGIPEPQFAVDPATNRLGVPAGYAGVMQYDPAGNLTNDTYTGQGTRSFDAEGRMTSAQDAYGQTSVYVYDADGRRTRRKVADGAEAWQVYGLGGELLAEYPAFAQPSTPRKEYGYRGGELLVQATAPAATGTGLTAQYFDNINFTGLKLTRTDAAVNFDWGLSAPHAAMGAEEFTVRWEGKVEPLYSQTYTFYTVSDDGVRLWVNGQLIIDKWVDQAPTEWSGQITLQAGQRYDIRLEFYERFWGATAKLLWSSASQAKEVVPQSRLYPTTAANPQAELKWLVSDQLGTPRMVIDKSGSLADVRRHDYLPFGEELYAGVGGRTWQQGYAGDNVRQQFTGYERDVETGLDFAQARHFASAQGRFTSVDPLLASGSPGDPRSWNRYAYALNSPLRYTDPTGMRADGLDEIPNLPDPPPGQRPATAPAAPTQPQTVDLRCDPTIIRELDEIRANATPLPAGESPVLSDVRVIPGETTTVENGTVIDAYGNATTGFTGTVRPVAYVPLDQRGNIIDQGNGINLIEDVRLVSGEMPTTSGVAPSPPGGVFIDIQSIPKGTQPTVVEQVVLVGQFPTRGGGGAVDVRTATSAVAVGINRISKNYEKKTIDVTLGKPRPLPLKR